MKATAGILSRYPSSSEAVVRGMSEREYADWLGRTGHKVLECEGRFWEEILPGFYEVLPYLARLSTDEARRPTRFAWGYRATLEDGARHAANGFMPVHLIRDLRNYGLHMVRPEHRRLLRRCLERTAVIQLTDASVLRSQGYAVYRSYATRLRVHRPLSASEYLSMVDNWFEDDRRLVLAAFAEDQLLGYADSFAVGPTAYLPQLHVSSSALRTNVTSALYCETLEAHRRSETATEACSGLHRPENQGLVAFKKAMGFEIVKVPILFHVPTLVTGYLKRRRPETYYRFTGCS